MFSFEKKVFVVTGGNGLLGQQIVSSLRNNGAIAINGDINFKDQSVYDFPLDITSEESVEKFISYTTGKFGPIHGWVNNAYPRTADWGKKLEDVPFDSWRKNIDMHLNGYYLCSKMILAEMKAQRFGSVVNMSSIYGMVAPDFSVYEGTEMTMPVAYSAIKGGINTLTKYLAAYFGPYNVRVNAVSPGGVFDNQNELFINNYIKKVPLRRLAVPADIIMPVQFLLSDASSYITGHNLIVDGGWTII